MIVNHIILKDMKSIQTLVFSEWDATYQTRKIGRVEVIAIQDFCSLLKNLSQKEDEIYTPQNIVTYLVQNFDNYVGTIYLKYKEFGVIKFRVDHYEAMLKKGDFFEEIFLNYIATEQLLQELLEIDGNIIEEQVDSIFKDSGSWL